MRARIGWPEKDGQNMRARTGYSEQEGMRAENRMYRICGAEYETEQDGQNRIVRIGWPE